MTIHVRRITEADIPAVSRLAVELAAQHQAYDPVRFSDLDNLLERFAAMYAELLDAPDAAPLVAVRDDRIIGYALVQMEPESIIEISDARAWLHDIFVDESARGTDAGRHLLNAAKEAAGRLGSRTLMLQVSPKNEFARGFFERNGFRPTMIEMMLDLDATP